VTGFRRAAAARGRFSIEAALALVSASVGLVTLVWKDWIELVFRLDPDRGNGALEWAIVAVLYGASVALGLVARRDWRRGQLAGPVG
jgi:hypothetical protein